MVVLKTTRDAFDLAESSAFTGGGIVVHGSRRTPQNAVFAVKFHDLGTPLRASYHIPPGAASNPGGAPGPICLTTYAAQQMVLPNLNN